VIYRLRIRVLEMALRAELHSGAESDFVAQTVIPYGPKAINTRQAARDWAAGLILTELEFLAHETRKTWKTREQE
jgi:hypothetical protein